MAKQDSVDPAEWTRDCRDCAACCRDASDGRILVEDADIERFERASLTEVVKSLVPGHFGLLGMPSDANGQCLYLGLPRHPFDCSIYEHRPESCRALQPGSAQCRAYCRVDDLQKTIEEKS